MQLLFTLLAQSITSANPQQGQSTVEYILVTLAAAMLAGVLIKLIGGVGKVVDIFNKVIDSILGLF